MVMLRAIESTACTWAGNCTALENQQTNWCTQSTWRGKQHRQRAKMSTKTARIYDFTQGTEEPGTAQARHNKDSALCTRQEQRNKN